MHVLKDDDHDRRRVTKWFWRGVAIVGIGGLIISIALSICDRDEKRQLSQSQISQQATAQAYSEMVAQPTARSTSASTSATATARAEEAENRRKGFHCLSWWDGNHDSFERLVRQRLNDPSSMETFETRVSPVESGKHKILMDFGARNALGGMVRKIAYGTYDHTTCEPTLISIE